MQPRLRDGLIILFVIAGCGLVWQIWAATSTATRILAIALLCLGIDQTRMAIVDLDNIATVKAQLETHDSALQRFEQITKSTILFELIGFYWSGWSIGARALSIGCAIVLLSQIWFNLFAGVQLLLDESQPIQDFGIRDRAVVLIADSVGLVLTLMVFFQYFPMINSSLLLIMVVIYLGLKYSNALTSYLRAIAADEG